MERLNTRVHFTSTLFLSLMDFLSETGLQPNSLEAIIDVAGSINAQHIDITEHARSIMPWLRLVFSASTWLCPSMKTRTQHDRLKSLQTASIA